MKILITGGAGFIGSHLSERLLKEGHQVDVIDDLSTGKRENVEHLIKDENFTFHLETILNSGFLEHLVRNCDFIFHLAASVGVKYIIDNPLKSIQINVRGTENVLENANRYKKRVFFSSTSEIYGKNDKVPLNENDDRILGSIIKRRWSYANTKALDEFLAMAYFTERKLPVTIVRLFNTVGPRQSADYGMVIPRFIKQALANKPITIFDDGKQTRCFMYVDDVIDAFLKLMALKNTIGEIFNIGSTSEISIEELAKKIVQLTDSKSELKYIPYEEAYEKYFEDMRRRVPDISKLKNIIDFEPETSIDRILVWIIEYIKSR